jgi:hypothetical protein
MATVITTHIYTHIQKYYHVRAKIPCQQESIANKPISQQSYYMERQVYKELNLVATAYG